MDSISNLSAEHAAQGDTHTSQAAEHAHLVELFRHLIAIPTVSEDYQANHEALEYIDQYVRDRGLHVARFVLNNVESLVATTRPTKTPRIMLAAHLDVVPGPEELFDLREQGDAYIGRGTFDMKFAIAAYLQLTDELQNNLADYDIGIMITTDEEIGGDNGVNYLVEQGYIPQAVILPDGGDNWAMETFAKGYWMTTLTAHGKSAHGSRPWEGESATIKLLDALAEIKHRFPVQKREDSTLNISRLSGGEVINQIPDTATASLDIRFGRNEDEQQLRGAIEDICDQHDITAETKRSAASVVNDPANPYLHAFSDAVNTITGHPAGTTISYGASDARYFSAKNVPCIIARPEGGGHHGPDEWISKQGFLQFYQVLLEYVRQQAKTVQ